MTTSIHKTDTSNRPFFVPYSHSDFTGKEKDEETGYGYFGARYMDHELMTMWLSVDPMADKYPSISPYAYCVWNPIKLVDPNGEDIYRLDTETGSLTLYRRTKDNKDIIEAGTTTGIGRAKHFKTSSTKEFSKGILNGRDGQDFSQTGFVTCGNLQEEAIDVAVFISFSCNKEVSGVGYDGIIGNHDVEVFAWSNNTCNNSDNPPSFIPSLGGKSTFHFHTHCGNKKGEYGSATPSVADKYAASSMRSAYGIDTFVIISKKEGSILYGENGRVSPYVGHLPTSVYFNY